MGDQPLRIAVLGAADIVPKALVEPAAQFPGVIISGIAARDVHRAEEFAEKHAIPKVFATYDALIEDPDVDAVYIPVPATLHGFWTRKAIAAGKHVLCEKPFAANAAEAREIATLAASSGLVVMEAFHSRYHPAWARLAEILASGKIGEILHARATFAHPLTDHADIRWQYELGGGALMDHGVYPLTLLRYLLGEPRVVGAEARIVDGVDAAMTINLAFEGDATAQVYMNIGDDAETSIELSVTGSTGELHMRMPYHPHLWGLITVKTEDGEFSETCDPRSTYSFQLEAFYSSVTTGSPVLTDAQEATTTMELVDASFRAAGLTPREPLQLQPGLL